MTPKNDDVPMIEEYRVESTIVHASRISRNAKIICICAMVVVVSAIIGMVRIVDIFTSKYNSRTKDWLDTLSMLANRIPVAEVLNGDTETLQQLPAP